MEKLFLMLCLLMSIALPVMAAEAEEQVEVEGYYAIPMNLQMVKGSEVAATFSTNNYREGLFDIYQNLILLHNVPSKLIDNNLSSMESLKIDEPKTIILTKPVRLTGYYTNYFGTYEANRMAYDFYDENDQLIASEKHKTEAGGTYRILDLPDVKKIVITMIGGTTNKDKYVAELDFFVDPSSFYRSVENMKVKNITEVSTQVEWINPNDKDLISNKVYINDKLFSDNPVKFTSINLSDLEPNTNYKITVSTVYPGGVEVFADMTFKTKPDRTPPGNVSNLKLEQNNTNVLLTYDLPKDPDFSHVTIFRDGVMIKMNHNDATYLDIANLQYNRKYHYYIIAYDKAGNASMRTAGTIELLAKEITKLTAKATYERVDLEWVLPTISGFQFVKIYRTNNDAPKPNLFKALFTNESAEKAIFETNGTFFNDLTVESDTNYMYRLTSNYVDKESEGVKINIKTPKITASGGGVVVDGNGNYKVSWEKPTTGQMQVLVGGALYTTVPASDLSVTIPKNDMKFTLIGTPDIKLIPIDENGNTGVPSTPGGSGNSGGNGGGLGGIVGGGTVNAVLNAPNLLKAGVALLGIVGAFVLLGMSFRVAPKLVRTIRTAYEAKNTRTMEVTNGRRLKK